MNPSVCDRGMGLVSAAKSKQARLGQRLATSILNSQFFILNFSQGRLITSHRSLQKIATCASTT
jgi:hypothetical protein